MIMIVKKSYLKVNFVQIFEAERPKVLQGVGHLGRVAAPAAGVAQGRLPTLQPLRPEAGHADRQVDNMTFWSVRARC